MNKETQRAYDLGLMRGYCFGAAWVALLVLATFFFMGHFHTLTLGVCHG